MAPSWEGVTGKAPTYITLTGLASNTHYALRLMLLPPGSDVQEQLCSGALNPSEPLQGLGTRLQRMLRRAAKEMIYFETKPPHPVFSIPPRLEPSSDKSGDTGVRVLRFPVDRPCRVY